MAKMQNVVPFPASEKERKKLLKRSGDPRLRIVMRLRRLTGWALAAAMLLFVLVNASLFSINTLRRTAASFSTGLAAEQTGDVIEYPSGDVVGVAALAEGLALADSDTLYIEKPGLTQLTEQVSYTSPVLTSCGDYVLAFDRGGYGLTLASELAVSSRQTLESPIISASLGESGDYAVVTNESGYRSAVTVFSAAGKQRFKWSTPDHYFLSAALSPDGKRMAVIGVAQNGGTLESTLYIRDLASEEVAAQTALGTSVPLAVGYLKEGVVAVVGDHSVIVAGRGGEIKRTISYAADDLMAFAFGDGVLALCLRSFSGTARSELTLITPDGKSSEPLLLDEELQAIDFRGGRIALLTARGLLLYDDSLRPLWKNTSAAGARRVVLGEGGAVWATFTKQAVRFTNTSANSEVIT